MDALRFLGYSSALSCGPSPLPMPHGTLVRMGLEGTCSTT